MNPNLYVGKDIALLMKGRRQMNTHAHRTRASCLPDSNPYGRDGLAHSRSLSPPRGALVVLPEPMSLLSLTSLSKNSSFGLLTTPSASALALFLGSALSLCGVSCMR